MHKEGRSTYSHRWRGTALKIFFFFGSSGGNPKTIYAGQRSTNGRIVYTQMTRFASLNFSVNKFLTLFVAGKKRQEKFMFRRNNVCYDGLYYGKLNWLRMDGRRGILNARFGFGGEGRSAGEYYVHGARFVKKKKKSARQEFMARQKRCRELLFIFFTL